MTLAYTNRGELYSVNDSAGTAYYSYDNNGNETGLTMQNGCVVSRTFDDANRLTNITNKNGSNVTLSSFAYSYNNDNTRADCTESNGDVVSWGYDALHRLTSESRTGSHSYSNSYTLDGVGNRTSQTVGGSTTSFTLNNDDELTATSGGFSNSYSYNYAGDQTGRTVGGTAYTLAYDFEGQLTSISHGGNTNSSYCYDALGRRFSRTASGTTTRFFYGPGGILAEKQGSSWTAAYTFGNGLIRKDSAYPMFDGLGSERTIRDASQNSVGSITFDAFGNTSFSSGSSASPYMFAATSGYRNDGDCGLVHVGARYYDPQVGRFITRDTELDQHPFLYCDHEPVTSLDPTGHNRLTEWIGRKLGIDLNFDRNDLKTIFDNIDTWGNNESKLGGAMVGISLGKNSNFKGPGTGLPIGPGFGLGKGGPVVGGIGAVLVGSGQIVRFIAWIGHWSNGDPM